MIEQHIKEVLREVDSKKYLVYNESPEKVDLLALVIKNTSFFVFGAKYKVLSTKLVHLIPALSEYVEVTEEDLIKDYKSRGRILVSGSAHGGLDTVSAHAKVGGNNQHKSSAVTIRMKKVDLPKLKQGYHGQKINTDWMPELNKGDVLGFVDRIIYNVDEVELHGQSEVDGAVKVSWNVILGFSAKGRKEGEMSGIVPAGHVYAYRFNKITFQDDKIKNTDKCLMVGDHTPFFYPIKVADTTSEQETFEDDEPHKTEKQNTQGTTQEAEVSEDDNSTENTHWYPSDDAPGSTQEDDNSTENADWYPSDDEPVTFIDDDFIYSFENFTVTFDDPTKSLAPETFEADITSENTYENLQQIQYELRNLVAVLQPLCCLPRATRSPLFQRLCRVTEEKDAVTALMEALDLWYNTGRFHLPQSLSASSTLDLLRLVIPLWPELNNMYGLLAAFYMLVNAMNKLPDHMPAMIANCSPDTLRALNQLVTSIRCGDEAQVVQPLPGPLQEGGELHWLTEFLCSDNDRLQDLAELTVVAGETPGMLLLTLCVTVRGLHMLQE